MENSLALNDEDFMRALEVEENKPQPSIEDTTNTTPVVTNVEPVTTNDDSSTEPTKDNENVEVTQQSQAPNTTSNSEEESVTDDTKEVIPETTDIDYKAFYEEVTKDYKASNKMMPGVKDPQKLIKALQMATDYAQKTAALKPVMKRAKLLEDVSDDELIEMLDFRNRNPEVIKKAIKEINVDPIDIDMENINYVPQSKVMSDSEFEFQETINKLSRDPQFVNTQNVIMQNWDEASRTRALLDPSIIEAVHAEAVSGRLQKIEAEVLQLKTFGQTNGLTDLELYASIAARMDKESVVQTTVVPQVVPAVESNNQTLDDKRSKATISTKKSVSHSQKYNPVKLSDEEFLKLINEGAEFTL